MKIRTGFGYDVHQLVSGRPLILGGVNIPFHLGLAGHSDADVLIHAIIDALLGALALGDIGSHFPDSDAQYKDINSRMLLRQVRHLLQEKGYQLGNLDATVCAQLPKLQPFLAEMRQNIAADLQTDMENISLKATTEEHLGISGSQQGMTASAVVLIFNRS